MKKDDWMQKEQKFDILSSISDLFDWYVCIKNNFEAPSTT